MSVPALLMVVALGAPLRAQASPPLGCAVALDSVDARVRRSYAGFRLEVAPTRLAAADSMRTALRSQADEVDRDGRSCTPVLQAYTGWFDDPHLFIWQNPPPDSAAARRTADRRVMDGRGEAELRADLDARAATRDPIEGIWRDGALRVAVIAERGRPDAFVAIVLTPDTATWPVGTIRGRFQRRGSGRYDATLLTAGAAELQLTATLHRRTILRLSPGMWGREYPVAAADTSVAPTSDPRAPRLAIRERSVVVAMPSHDGRYMRALDSLVSLHREALRAARLIILDLRGNEGGGSLTSRSLHPFLASAERRPTPFDGGTPVMLASSDLLAYVRRNAGASPSPAAQRLLARMEAAPDQFVPAYDSGAGLLPSATPLDGPWTVAVLTDGGTVSAAEVTVLMALRSTRAVVIGEPTAGALDYQSVALLRLASGERRWAVGIPTVAAHEALPARGMRGRGIAPQIPVSWDGIADPYALVETLVLDRRNP